MKYVLIMIMFCVVMCSCEDQGNTGTVRRYARGMRGCGDGRFNAQVWYTDDYGDTLTGGGMRLGQVGDYYQYWCDNYDTPPTTPQGYCSRVKLSGGSITGAGGKVTIKGIAPSGCEEHPSNYGHQAHGYWGLPELCMNVGFIIGTPPPYSPVAMWPNDNCPTPDYKPPTLVTAKGPISGKSSKSLGAPTSGGAPTAMTTMSFGPVVIDPNAIVLPASGIEWDVFLVRQFDDNAVTEDTVSASNSDHWEDNYRYQVPCVYEILVMCSEPVSPADVEELTGDGYVKTNLLPEGIPVELKPVTSNADNTVWLLMTDKFLPVQPQVYIDLMNDPNEHVIFDRWTPISADEMHLYDPNMYEDPNDCANLTLDTTAHDFMDRHDTTRVLPMEYLPCNDVDTIRFQFEPSMSTYIIFFTKWLQADYNVGGDNGYVDLEDWAAWFSY